MEKLPVEYENSFVGKIKKFFRNLFFKEENLDIENEHTEKKKVLDIPESNIFDAMQRENKKFENEKFIVQQTVKNSKLIKNLSKVQKEKLDELYDKKIEENNKVIMQNNKKITDLEARLNKIYDDKIQKNSRIIEENNKKIEKLKSKLNKISA